jgi:ferredoxin
MRARIDPDICTGCELCVGTCPQVFEMRDEVSVVISEPVPADAEECAKQAADECPVTAIFIEE